MRQPPQQSLDMILEDQVERTMSVLRPSSESLILSILSQGLWENEHTIEVSLKHLKALCDYEAADCEMNRSLLHDLGGHYSLVKIMQDHLQNKNIQQCCCEVLSLISLAGCEGEILIAGGLRYAIKAMECYSSDPDLQEAACALIALLIADEDSMGTVVHGGGLDATLVAMIQHASNPVVQTSGLYVLHVLLEEGQNRAARMIGNAGGVEPVVAALIQHRDAELVQIEACKILCKLAAADENCRTRILAVNGTGAIWQSTKVHQENPDVMAVALRTLQLLNDP